MGVEPQEALEGAFEHKLLILDLAMPRDVDPRTSEIDGVELFSLEDLNTVINRNTEKKVREAEKAKEIVTLEVGELWNVLTDLEPEEVLLP